MLNRIILSVLVAVIVILGCILVGSVLIALDVDVAETIGGFLKTYSGVIGVLAGLWYFFAGKSWPEVR